MGSKACLHYVNIITSTELHSNVVIWVNNKVYIFVSMTLNTTHVRGKGGYNEWITLKLGRCVCVRYLRMCAKFHGSMINSLGENPFGGFKDLSHLIFLQNFF